MLAGPTVIALIDYGAGNLRSVEFAFERIGAEFERAATPADLTGASGILLPGVGAADTAMAALRRRGMDAALRETRVPLLGVCLGMQLLTERSDEGSGVRCLGRVPGRTARFTSGVRVPQVGWNRVDLADDPLFEGLGEGEHLYFLHSLRVDCDEPLVIGRAEYGEPFPAALRNGSVAGVQFHPEKSGAVGLRILRNFCRLCGRGSSC